MSDIEKRRLCLKLLVGPLLFSGSIMAYHLYHSTLSLWPALLVLMGLTLSALFGKRGFILSTILLSFTLAVWVIDRSFSFFDAFLSFSFLLSWYISAMLFERVTFKKVSEPFILEAPKFEDPEAGFLELKPLLEQIKALTFENELLNEENSSLKELYSQELNPKKIKYTRLKKLRPKKEEATLFDL